MSRVRDETIVATETITVVLTIERVGVISTTIRSVRVTKTITVGLRGPVCTTQESSGSRGYWRTNCCNACFMYISLASSFDHCTQGGTRDGGDMTGPKDGFPIINYLLYYHH